MQLKSNTFLSLAFVRMNSNIPVGRVSVCHSASVMVVSYSHMHSIVPTLPVRFIDEPSGNFSPRNAKKLQTALHQIGELWYKNKCMDVHDLIALLLDPSRILLAQGLPPDAWQRALLLAPERQILLNCSRQSGKSTTVSALALHTALFTPGGLVLLLSPSLRQSGEIFRKVLCAYRALRCPLRRAGNANRA